MVISGKTFMAAYWYTYIANQHGHKFMENICGRVNNHENRKCFPLKIFILYSNIYKIWSLLGLV